MTLTTSLCIVGIWVSGFMMGAAYGIWSTAKRINRHILESEAKLR